MIKPFEPDLVYYEPGALDYPLGKELVARFQSMNIPVRPTTSHNQVTGLPGETPLDKYRIAKRTLVIGVKKSLKFEQSKPSAEYAIPLATGCMGHCHYCYLQTTLGKRPYIRIYVNLDEIFSQAEKYIQERAPKSPGLKPHVLPIRWASNIFRGRFTKPSSSWENSRWAVCALSPSTPMWNPF